MQFFTTIFAVSWKNMTTSDLGIVSVISLIGYLLTILYEKINLVIMSRCEDFLLQRIQKQQKKNTVPDPVIHFEIKEQREPQPGDIYRVIKTSDGEFSHSHRYPIKPYRNLEVGDEVIISSLHVSGKYVRYLLDTGCERLISVDNIEYVDPASYDQQAHWVVVAHDKDDPVTKRSVYDLFRYPNCKTPVLNKIFYNDYSYNKDENTILNYLKKYSQTNDTIEFRNRSSFIAEIYRRNEDSSMFSNSSENVELIEYANGIHPELRKNPRGSHLSEIEWGRVLAMLGVKIFE